MALYEQEMAARRGCEARVRALRFAAGWITPVGEMLAEDGPPPSGMDATPAVFGPGSMGILTVPDVVLTWRCGDVPPQPRADRLMAAAAAALRAHAVDHGVVTSARGLYWLPASTPVEAVPRLVEEVVDLARAIFLARGARRVIMSQIGELSRLRDNSLRDVARRMRSPEAWARARRRPMGWYSAEELAAAEAAARAGVHHPNDPSDFVWGRDPQRIAALEVALAATPPHPADPCPI